MTLKDFSVSSISFSTIKMMKFVPYQESTSSYQVLNYKFHSWKRLISESDAQIQFSGQLMEQENIITSMGRSDDRYSSEFQQLSQELQNSKEEVSDLMRALEDLAVSYEQKAEALGGIYVFYL